MSSTEILLKHNNPLPNVVNRNTVDTLSAVSKGPSAILIGEGNEIEIMEKVDSEVTGVNLRSTVYRPTSANKSRPMDQEKGERNMVKNSPRVGQRSALLTETHSSAYDADAKSSQTFPSSPVRSRGDVELKNSTSSHSSTTGGKHGGDPVPQGGRKMRPQSAQRRRPSLTPNLDIIPEVGPKCGPAGVAGAAVPPHSSAAPRGMSNEIQALNIGDVKSVGATSWDPRWPLELLLEKILEAPLTGTGAIESGSGSNGGGGLSGHLERMFAEAKDRDAVHVRSAQSEEMKLSQMESVLTDAEDGGGAESGRDTALDFNIPKLTRNLSFSSNGLLPEAGEEEADDTDIDRISHLKAGKSKVTGGMTANRSMPSLGGAAVAADCDTVKESKEGGPPSANTATNLQLNATGLISTHISMGGSMPGGDLVRGLADRGLASRSSSREGSVSDSRPGSSHRRPDRMVWMSTGLATHSLTIGLFAHWNLHKITFVVSGVESIEVASQDRENINNTGAPPKADGPRVEATFVGNVRMPGYASGTMGVAAQSFPSLSEDKEYTPGPDADMMGSAEGQSSLYPRYNIEEYANVEGEDSDTGTESDDGASTGGGGGGYSSGGRGRGRGHFGRGGSRRRGSGHRAGLELQHFDLALDNNYRHVVGGHSRLVPGLQKDGSLLAKSIVITFRLRAGFDFIAVKAIRILAKINDL